MEIFRTPWAVRPAHLLSAQLLVDGKRAPFAWEVYDADDCTVALLPAIRVDGLDVAHAYAQAMVDSINARAAPEPTWPLLPAPDLPNGGYSRAIVFAFASACDRARLFSIFPNSQPK